MGEDLAGGADGGAAIGAEFGVLAVVEHDIGGPSFALVPVNFLDQLSGDVIGGGIDPVAGHGVPGDRRHAEFAGGAERVGAARAIGRTEEVHGLAGDLSECVAGARELFADAGGCGAGEVGMGPRVIADEVAGFGNAADERWLGMSEAAHHEEGGVGVVRGEDVEEAWRPCGVGPVVEGKGEFAGAGWGDEGGAEDLRAGDHRGVGVSADGQADCGCGAEACVDPRS